jgi:3-oxoacyl-[acyl-carrier-protein] synthase III
MSSTLSYSQITGTGSYLPGEPVTNDVFAQRLAADGVETSNEWIVARTGIQQRYFASIDETTSFLATQAAKRALDMAKISSTQLDLIIVATSTPDMIFPSTACLVQAALGNSGAAAFDVQAVCSGFAYALATADAMIKAGNAKHALVIGAETFSRILDFSDRGTCVLFGDGAGAIVLSASDSPGVLATALHADGKHHDILCTAGSVSSGRVTGHPFLTMDGQAVFKLAVNVLESIAHEVCSKARFDISELDWLIPHQANVRILSATGKKLGLDPSKVIVTVDKHANTSAASIPLALDQAVRSKQICGGQTVLMQGVGGGFTWGAALVRMKDLIE